MDLEYDMKFEEMKKYIPFLESMIKRLESTGSGSTNPRQAQLDKIRSLRDLLLVKKKRMKMENLLKCEQVLVNLYTKVEQRDTLPGIQPASKIISPKEKSDLNLARSKLKTLHTSHDPDTLPEIARASEMEVVCVPGSKEPALFQRRPNKSSVSPTNRTQSRSPQKSSSKRNYTRVLVSPDRSNRLWSPSDGTPSDKQLFSRRSPKAGRRRDSPSYHKRDRKKSSKQESHSRNAKEKFNITLKVPEESLDSLNTKDILSRIINCSDSDVDIATLRELRTQILGELKQTGANEDISGLILKSYNNKKRKSKNKKDDVEEGELSDSESEAIESIYGNLVVVDKNKAQGTSSHQNKSADKSDAPRKIQICLVINSDKDQKSSEASNKNETAKCDASDFQMFDDNECTIVSQPAPVVVDKDAFDTEILSNTTDKPSPPLTVNLNKSQEIITIEDTDTSCLENKRKNRETVVIDMNNFDLQDDSTNIIEGPLPEIDPVPYKANFYKPLFDHTKPTEGSTFDIPLGTFTDHDESTEKVTPIAESVDTPAQTSTDKSADIPAVLDDKPNLSEDNEKSTNQSKMEELTASKESKTDGENKDLECVSKIDDSQNTHSSENNPTESEEISNPPKVNEKGTEIPLLNEPTVQPVKKDVVSEIDILQALKNEILSETIALPCGEVATPALHQPKVTKVSNAQDLPKKRISIENYKQKISKPSKQASLFITHPSVLLSKEESRKQSLKLTEKEVERFKIAAAVDSSDDEDNHAPKSPEEDLAPKSPDMDLLDGVSASPPVIIPEDPVKAPVVSSKADVDMRQMPAMSPTVLANVTVNTSNPIKNTNQPLQKPVNVEPKWPAPPFDPRIRSEKEPLLPAPSPAFPTAAAPRTSNKPPLIPTTAAPTFPAAPLLPTPSPAFPTAAVPRSSNIPPLMPNLAPKMTPNRTPTRTPNMTPNARSFDVTPNRPFESDDTTRKHVYAPLFGASQSKPASRMPVWEHDRNSVTRETPNWDGPSSDRDQSSGRKWDSRDPRSNFAHREDGPRSLFSEPNYDNNYNRSRNDRYGRDSRDEYNRKDGPQTSSYFGRSECPVTPTPSFGRGDAPATPTHYFGRSECPTTPSHSFGRSEGPPLTPSHPFGRSDPPSTPGHPFGRGDAPSTPGHPFGRGDAPSTPSHPFGRSDYAYKNQPSKYAKPQDPRLNRNYDNDPNRRDQPYNDRYRYNRNDPRNVNREQSMERIDKQYISDYASNRDSHRDYDKGYSRERSGPERSYAEVGMRRPYQREPSVGRSVPDQRARASSVSRGRSCERDTTNKVSIGNKWDAGRAFTIDTSVNSTFQKFLDSHRTSDTDNFDARRQRASSVGRSLTREPSVGRNVSFNSSHNIDNNNRNKFQRAQSVGRDFSRAQSVGRELKERPRNEKSFQEIKAEFESYRKNDEKLRQEKVPSRPYGNINSRDPRCRRDSYEDKQDRFQSYNKSHTKEPNVPIKKINYRDPRQRKEQKFREGTAYNKGNITQGIRSDSRDRHSYGISSESVAKTPVINSVRNYKIPKIKRPVEETPEPEVKIEPKKSQSKPIEKEAIKQKSTSIDKKIEKKEKPGKKNNADKSVKKNVPDEKSKLTVELSGKRVTRQSERKNEVNKADDDEIVSKPRKFKKVIYHSDSDENVSDKETKSENKVSTPKDTNISTVPNTTTYEKIEDPVVYSENVQENDQEPNNDNSDENPETLDISFGLDDMDLFSDNIIADPVLDNINVNALIADLDSDLDAPKGNASCADLFSDMNIENMLAKITTSPVKPYNNTVVSSKTGVENIKKDLFDSLKQSELVDSVSNKSQAIAEAQTIKQANILNDRPCSEVTNSDVEKPTDVSKLPQTEIINETDDKSDPEAVVSTSVNEEDPSKKDQSVDSEKVNDGRSTPDSTNDTDIMIKKPQEVDRLHGAVEKQCEMNSDISSTHDSGEKPSDVAAEESKDITTQIDPIGSILSILQDKSKIKELLSMLGGQSLENDKIKKKLEKLSAIVSDDEDSNDGKGNKSEQADAKTDVPAEKENEKDKVGIENKNDEVQVKKDKVDIENRNEEVQVVKDKLEMENERNKEENDPSNPVEQTEVQKMGSEADKSVETHVKNLADKECDDKKTELTEKEDESPSKSTEDMSDVNQDDESLDNVEETSEPQNKKEQEAPENKVTKKKVLKRFKTGKFKRGRGGKKVLGGEKRVTRSEGAVFPFKPKTVKKPSRELKQLQESIKEMFMSDDILNASGIRMCRLAKMVDDKISPRKDAVVNESEPVVVLEKVKHGDEYEASTHAVDSKNSEKLTRKKPGPKPKMKSLINPEENEASDDKKALTKYRPGPKSKTKMIEKETDPYDFETDSLNDSKNSEKAIDNSSDSDNDSLTSSKSFGSSDLLVEIKKKPKRKRPGWQAGVIKPKHKKKKVEAKRAETPPREPTPEPERQITIPDIYCFIDKKYCFSKNTNRYPCRLCVSTHNFSDIVSHYKKHHPHSEIPLSRMSPEIAREAIEQCEEINFQAISKIPTEKYTCRFCFKEFARKRASLEAFFWHVVSMHTGEYKQLCSECINVTRCPFNLDIPPPPKDIKGQLIGYICGKCNFTQISLENLKMHVIVRHNDEQTEVYTINFAVMTRKTISSLVKRCGTENKLRVTRSSRSNQSLTEPSDDRSDITESEPEAPQAKVSDSPAEKQQEVSNLAYTENSAVKVEADDDDDNEQDTQLDQPLNELDTNETEKESEVSDNNKKQSASDDIMDYPHFKIRYTDAGNKEYVCCINGTDNHYKTGLLISMKKHVQFKHSDRWDGYCFMCKVIVTSQGQHKFTECLQHFLDKHMDNFPVLEKEAESVSKTVEPPASEVPETPTPKSYINVRPLAELLVNTCEAPLEAPVALPVIENVVSLLPSTAEPPRPSPTYPVTRKEIEPLKEYKYEEAQADIMLQKHRVVLDAMMAADKLVQVFKCAGRFCSFTSDSAEDALLHASTHQRVGGTNALMCTYCDFDSSGNSIDLVSHVFKSHGRCQYFCNLCFYRAAASQLVGAHIARVHGTAPTPDSILKAHNMPAVTDSTEGNMTREAAVPLYVCKQIEREETCLFKTVMHMKFLEHFKQRHEGVESVICYVCDTSCSDPTSLVLHLKTHGLKLYHCTLCVFGADSEVDLLAHASAKHPAKPPQAYIRTVLGTPTTGLKILPLVELKKTALPAREVTPKAKENPVREAERSIELEKLIGHISILEEPTVPTPVQLEPRPTAQEETPQDISTEVEEAMTNILEHPETIPPMATLMPVPPLIPIANRTTTPDANLSGRVTPVLKEEPKETSEKTPDVICLDSDDEDSKHGIISLSDDETPAASEESATPKKSPNNVYRCGKCPLTCSSFHGFKKHLNSCYTKNELYKCGYCSYATDNMDKHITHYDRVHAVSAPYSCGLCDHKERFPSSMKKHVKTVHNVSKIIVKSSFGEAGEIHYVVSGAPEAHPKAGRPVKRKSYGAPVTPTKRRYGPSDIDKLPINPILDELVHCDMCEFNTKVRLNMVRHLQLHAEQQPVPQVAPVNPVPHLETNEKHFDKMVNLASSSAATRPQQEKPAKEPVPTVFVPPEMATRYPKYVPERHRHTCGAKGCSYISVDEGMLRRHWETLHSGTTDYHCVHCPPYQHLDKSKPLTAARIIAHLKMHDIRLYACSICPYYHYKRQVLEKHMSETHRSTQVMVVREEAVVPPPTPPTAAPTMDLKPWQCGLCKFKSMLRPEVAEHCYKVHHSKMQFKCAYCPFRTSVSENVTKHQTSSHANREPEIFYFYYREDSVPDEADGTPLWQKQRQKTGVEDEPEVKAEVSETATLQHYLASTGPILPQIQPQPIPEVNLNLVKQEVDQDLDPDPDSVESLCKKFGEFCEPNGLSYKCSLCKVTFEDSRDAMQSHLYEELQYRKWGCRLCSYKAFHQTGLNEHMWTEHRQNQEPIELPVDTNVEAWVSKLLEYQEDLIKKNKEKLAQQKIQGERPQAQTSKTAPTTLDSVASKLTMQELEKYFGPLGTPCNMMFSCPKCQFMTKDEVAMHDHLEAELSKIRWCCSNCSSNFTTYHEAQFHCKSVHTGQAARPVEAARDPGARAAWVAAALRVQRLATRCMPITTTPAPEPPAPENPPETEENSLLVIRYEETVPTPEEETLRRSTTTPVSATPDSDDDTLTIDEQPNKKSGTTECPHCEFKTKYPKVIKGHILRHYNLKPYTCPYCDYNNYKPYVLQHIGAFHPDNRVFATHTILPRGPPSVLELTKIPKKPVSLSTQKPDEHTWVCLTCEQVFSDANSKTHVHDKIVPKFAKRGEIVAKCCECLVLLPDVVAMQRHYTSFHPNSPINYAYYKLLQDTRDQLFCFHCNQRFPNSIDLRSHHKANHGLLKVKYCTIPYVPGANELPPEPVASLLKRKAEGEATIVPPMKRCARKSTTKLPQNKTVAKKSTAKLPFFVESDSESDDDVEYSYYGTKPTSWDELTNVTTLMPFCNTMMPFTLQKLSEIIKLNPKVVVKDCKK